MPEYELLPSDDKSVGGTVSVDLDWRKDDAMVKETKWGGVVTFVDGHVDEYKLGSVLRMGFFKIKAPVFSDPFVMLQTAFILGMVAVVAVTFMLLHTTRVLVLDSNLVDQSASIFDYFGNLSGFLFGFFVFDQLAAYTNLKNNYLGGYWGAFSETLFLTSVWFPAEDKATKEFKTTIVRWGLAAYSLMCGAADPDTSEAECTARCVDRGLLTAEEAELVTRMGGAATVPLLWMFDVFETNLAGKPGDAFKVNKIEDKVLGMRAGISNVLTQVSSFGLTPLPLIHMMSALVKIQLFLLSIKEGVFIANVIIGDTGGKGMQIFFSLLMAVSTPVIFQGLLEFVIMIRNPFGKDWVDLPTQLIHQQIRDEMFQYAGAGEGAAAIPSVKAAKLK